MRGAIERERLDIEAQAASAWHCANLMRADPKKFPSLKHFLAMLKPQAATTPNQLLAGFRAFAKAGLAVKIGRLSDGEEE